MNIFEFDSLYRRRINAKGVPGEPVYLSLERVDPRIIRHLTHVTVLNRTSDYTLVRLSIFDGATDFLLDELTHPTQNELAVAKEDIILQEGDVFRAILTGTKGGDLLEMVAIGWDKRRE